MIIKIEKLINCLYNKHITYKRKPFEKKNILKQTN